MSKSRPGLYFMVGVAMLGTCDNSTKLNQLEREVALLQDSTRIHRVADVRGDTIPENFYVIGKDTAFVSIDGQELTQTEEIKSALRPNVVNPYLPQAKDTTKN